MDKDILWGQGQAVLADCNLLLTTEDDYILTTENDELLSTEDELAITNPDLHRRINTDLAGQYSPYYIEVGEDSMLVLSDDSAILAYAETGSNAQDFKLAIKGLNSYRTTITYIHDDESEDSEIP